MPRNKENYRVEIVYWGRSADGDDAIDCMIWRNFETLAEALNYANVPGYEQRHLIESTVYDCRDKYETNASNLLYQRDWIKNKIIDYTTIPDFDYHNREY